MWCVVWCGVYGVWHGLHVVWRHLNDVECGVWCGVVCMGCGMDYTWCDHTWCDHTVCQHGVLQRHVEDVECGGARGWGPGARGGGVVGPGVGSRGSGFPCPAPPRTAGPLALWMRRSHDKRNGVWGWGLVWCGVYGVWHGLHVV